MVTKITFAAAVIISLASGPVFAESEGNGNPFPAQSVGQVTHGAAFVNDTGSGAYPTLTGIAAGRSGLALVDAASSNEALIQTANSQPRGFVADPVAVARTHAAPRRVAGAERPAG